MITVSHDQARETIAEGPEGICEEKKPRKSEKNPDATAAKPIPVVIKEALTHQWPMLLGLIRTVRDP